MQQRKSVNFEEWKTAYKEGFDSFVLSCGDKTAPVYADKLMSEDCVESVNIRHDGVHVVFKRDKPAAVEPFSDVEKIIKTGACITAFILGFLVSFTITFFVMYGG